ncbi:MAG: metallophosphoesterase [Polyangiaceae bacterium]|nr:metallophosphoesterase [Polyangiaceae bacterium]
MFRRVSLGLLALASACSSGDDSGGSSPPATPPAVAQLPALASVKTTRDGVRTPRHARADMKAQPNPALTENWKTYDADGWAETDVAPGDPYVPRTLDGSPPPAAGAAPKRLVRFAHLSDLQLLDDESPNRASMTDGGDPLDAALRPSDAEICRMTNAAVRTINALSKADPIDFVLMGGDNADSAQSNEYEWVLSILGGSDRVECDSGDDDDPVPGPDNDGKDPFRAEGLAMPWKWVTGNHDVLVIGNFKVDDSRKATVLGDRAALGTRDWSRGGVVDTGDFVKPDPRRALLAPSDSLARVLADKDGHGLSQANVDSGKAFYTFDVPSTPIRFFVLDTTHSEGGSEGVLTKDTVTGVIKPVLDQARADKKWVVLASHHSADSLTPDGGAFGKKGPEAVTKDEWLTFLGGYDNVLFSMVGHAHVGRVTPRVPTAGHGYWEVMTPSIADFPNAFRTVEIWDQDNGWVMLRATVVDVSSEGDKVTEIGLRHGVTDATSGWLPGDNRRGDPTDRNVELWIKKPAP